MPVLRIVGREKMAQGLAMGMSADASHTAAGYKPNRKNAARMKSYEDIIGRVAELMAPAVEAAEATIERVVKEMTRLAFYDMTAVLEVRGDKIILRDPASLPEDLRRAIVGIKPVEVDDDLHYECKFADKQRALDSLARHLQMFKDTVIVENVFRIVNEMDDDELDRRLTELERAFTQAATLDPAAGEGPTRIH